MRLARNLFVGVMFFGLLAVPAARGADDVAGLFKVMPSEAPMAIVFPNLEKFDKAVIAFMKRMDPDGGGDSILADIKEQLGMGDWVDFTKPIGMAEFDLTTGEGGVVWVRVADFASKVKEKKNAKEEDGVWHVTPEDGQEMYLKVSGDYVLAAKRKTDLDAALGSKKSLAEHLGARMSVYEGRDVAIHLGFEPLRPLMLAQIAQAAQMAPMLGMMAGPQMGISDPSILVAGFTSLFDGVKSFFEQLDYLQIALSLDDKSANVSIVSGYGDGAIKSYLAKQKPAAAVPFEGLEEQPFLMAMAYQFPGSESPFIDYVFDKIEAAMKPADGTTPVSEEAKKALELSRTLQKKIEGQNMLVNFGPEGMRLVGDLITSNAPEVFKLQQDSLLASAALTSKFGAKTTYTSTGTKKIDTVEAHLYSVKMEAGASAAASGMKMYGDNSRFGVAQVGDRVRYALDQEKDIEKAFAAKPVKSLSTSPKVSEAMATLPAKRNFVMLLDLAAVVPMIAAMSGDTSGTPLPPGPLVGMSANFSGDSARVDIYVPIKAIERLVQAFSPKQPT